MTARLLFGAMCLIWGLTWIAAKIGVAAVPPLFFAGTRFLAAGLVMAGWLVLRDEWLLPARADWRRILAVGLIMNALSVSLMFWAMQHVASGLAAIINLSLMPVSLFAIGLLYGEERFRWRQLGATAAGILGLALLLGPKAQGGGVGVLGEAAIVAATVAYAWGSVISRPLLRRYSPLLLSATTMLIGGLMMTLLSFAIERVDAAHLAASVTPAVAMSWLFLTLAGSLAAFTIFLRLVRDWGAARAGMYAFVSPAVAVAVGAGFFGERFGALDVAGMSLMLAATWLSLAEPARAGQQPAS